MEKINETTLYRLLSGYTTQPNELDGFKIIEQILTYSDQEDGGGHYDLILQELSSGKFYLTTYCDWDIENTDYDYDNEIVDGRCDLNCHLVEVEPKEVTVIKYVPKWHNSQS
jgi:hypothetical protein